VLIAFFDYEGVVYHTFVPRGQTMNKKYYLEVLKSLREAVRKKRLLIREFFAKNETTVVPQPPYSPDLAPANFFLFPKLTSTLKGRRFESIEEIEKNSLTELRAIKKNSTVSKTGKKKRRERCIKSGGEYFEGDKAD
jgi:transposase